MYVFCSVGKPFYLAITMHVLHLLVMLHNIKGLVFDTIVLCIIEVYVECNIYLM